jgi:tripartite-type tricarboxylate transporter receptor subunit TctC
MTRIIAVCCLAALALLAPAPGSAAPYPTRVVTIIVPFPAGGATDVVARTIAHELSGRIGQQVIVENRPGANGLLGSAVVARAAPDGYTLLMGGANTQGMNDVLYKNRPYDSLKDFSAITLTAQIPVAIVVNPSLPVNCLQELVALAKAEPGQLSYGSSGAGGPHHMAMELFKSVAGADIEHVPYKGGAPQLNDLVAGHIKIGAIGLPPALPHVREGRLRPLAVTGRTRTAFLPELPTVAESGFPGFEVNYWLGLFGPAGMPGEVVDKLNVEVVGLLKRPDVRDLLAKQGVEILTSTPAELQSLVAVEIERWGKVVKERGIALD